jgi:hypothetical protein
MKRTRALQSGAVLIVSLLFLLLITLVATTGAQTSTLQLQMAGNEQSRVEAQQRALALLDAIIDDADNAPVVGNIGFKICDESSTDTSCDLNAISLDTTVTTLPAGVDLEYFVTRVGPLEIDAPTMSEAEVSSASAYKLARQEVTATIDGIEERLGGATIVQGVNVRIPAQSN